MAGTGKSQVIKALIHFFEKRKEGYRFMCIVPTGTAASLIGGSTYHSMLGFNHFGSNNTMKNFVQVRSKLHKVDYIFLDEVSMLDCHGLYEICAKLCSSLNNDGEPFGGMNMIFAGDFAQLPPAGNRPTLYSPVVNSVVHTTNGYKEQESAIGKAMWHQVTTVVILRENMRQRSQTPEDAKLRIALENLRYKSCTTEDIGLINSRVAGKGPGKPKLGLAHFRNVFIITAWNSHRDKINELGCIRFAKEMSQKLHVFYSVDTWAPLQSEGGRAKRKTRTQEADPNRESDIIQPHLQERFWNLIPKCSENHAGKLYLCVGMPVMIKHNYATECSVTNGAEGIVTGWQAFPHPLYKDKQALSVLFVRLTSAPTPVQLEGLPENVVPIKYFGRTINGKEVSIYRMQPPVLLNFAMTDFASQGCTRPNNVCDLQNSRTHQSMYIALSRGSTYEGTVIVQPFDGTKLTGGVSGYLRQEFRELEMLDDITKLRFEGTLPENVDGVCRNALIYSYRLWKGDSHTPDNMHGALKWTKENPFPNDVPADEYVWEKVEKPSKAELQKQAKDKKESAPLNKDTTYYVAAKSIKILTNLSEVPKKRIIKPKRKPEAVVDQPSKKKKLFISDQL